MASINRYIKVLNNTKIAAIFALLLCISSTIVYSYEIESIKIVGKTVDLEFSGLKKSENKKKEISEEEIRKMAAKITDRYHSAGYTAAYIDKITVKKDGTLEIHVHETKIFGIDVIGVDDNKRTAIEKELLPESGEVFNKFLISKRVKAVKKKYLIGSITINIEKNENNNIFLLVKVKEKGGSFYGRVGYDINYGISPLAGYYYPFKKSILDIYALAGYKENKFRRLEGGIKYYIFLNDSSSAIYFDINSGRYFDIWESEVLEYTILSVTPKIGYMHKKGIVTGYFYFSEGITRLTDYPGSSKYYDSSLNAALDISNRDKVLEKIESSSLRVKVSGGWYNYKNTFYLKSSVNGNTAFSLFPGIWLIPRVHISYTTSKDRFFWEYVFDNNFLVFFNDYTASRWKNVAGLDTDIEISPGLLYFGPFINSGYYINEDDMWARKTGAGIKGRVLYSNFEINIYYAWGIAEGLSKGGFFFTVTGRF